MEVGDKNEELRAFLNKVCDEVYAGNVSKMASESSVERSRLSKILSGDIKRVDAAVVQAVKNVTGVGLDQCLLIIHSAKVSAGTGMSEYDNMVRARIEVHRHILKAYLGIPNPPRRIGVAEVSGDCMMPDLAEGDAVFFEYDRRFTGNGRYVIWTDHGPEVKRLQQYRDGTIRISCDNHAVDYKDEVLKPNRDIGFILEATGNPVELLIVGPVIWPRKSVSTMLMEEVKTLILRGYAENGTG